MVEEPYFSIPAKIAPPVQTTVVATPVVDVGVSGTSQSEQVAHTTIESESHAPTVHEPPELEEEIVNEDPPPQQPQVVEEDVPIRRSQRVRRLAIPDDYEVYISVDMNSEGDPTSYEEAIKSPNSSKWLTAMEDEIRSMSTNKVWDLTEIPKRAKTVGCKWVYKTKRGSRGNIERYKARLVAKGFTQREGIDYNETFSPVSMKDSFRIIMELVAHFDLELH